MKFFKKPAPSMYRQALADAEGCHLSTRHGDKDSDRKVGDTGVRVMVSDFGNYLPFILTGGTRNWLRRAYTLTEHETQSVYGILVARSRKMLRQLEDENRRLQKLSSPSHIHIPHVTSNPHGLVW